MKKISVLFLLLIGVMMLAACNDGETYADQKKRETAAINAFIQKNNIKVISEASFMPKIQQRMSRRTNMCCFPQREYICRL